MVGGGLTLPGRSQFLCEKGAEVHKLCAFLFGALCIPSSKWTGDRQLEGAHFRAGEGEAGGDRGL